MIEAINSATLKWEKYQDFYGSSLVVREGRWLFQDDVKTLKLFGIVIRPNANVFTPINPGWFVGEELADSEVGVAAQVAKTLLRHLLAHSSPETNDPPPIFAAEGFNAQFLWPVPPKGAWGDDESNNQITSTRYTVAQQSHRDFGCTDTSKIRLVVTKQKVLAPTMLPGKERKISNIGNVERVEQVPDNEAVVALTCLANYLKNCVTPSEPPEEINVPVEFDLPKQDNSTSYRRNLVDRWHSLFGR